MALLRREEATYSLIDGHFAIDCACGVAEGVSFKNHIWRGAFGNFEKNYELSKMSGTNEAIHTFYVNIELIEPWLDKEHHESEGKRPLEIICKKCDKNFKFTYESFQKLMDELHQSKML